MRQFLDDFKKFVMRGNVLDLAVALIVGAAFNGVVQSLTNDVILPFIAAIGGKPTFAYLTFNVGKGVVKYGVFITTVVNFVIVAFSVFLIVKVFETLQRLRSTEEKKADPTELDLLTEIRDLLAAARSPEE